MRNQGLVLAAVLAVVLAACGDDEAARNASRDRDRDAGAEEADAEASTADAGDTGADGDAAAAADGEAAAPAPKALIDADSMALMAVFDDHVVASAKLAQARGADVRVKALAKEMEATHAAHRGKVAKLERATGAITAFDQVDGLEATLGGRTAAIDESVDGAPLDVAFLEDVIASHTEVLALLDGQMLPGSRNDAVREHLGTARSAIAAELEKAQAILSDY